MKDIDNSRLFYKRARPSLIIIAVITIISLVVVPAGCKAVPSSTTSTLLSSPAITPSQLSKDNCFACHNAITPGVTRQFSQSHMAIEHGVTCTDCHLVAADYPGAQAHYGTFFLVTPTPAKCQACHAQETQEYMQSRHSLPAYVAVNGATNLNAAQLAMYQAIPEGLFDPNKSEHPLAALEGPAITSFACNACHSIGQPHADSSVGQCQSCHLTHTFSLEQARKPETCNACHIGPDHPQTEIYAESAHGIAYATDGQNWNWEAPVGKMSIADIQAPTCATCHFSAFGGAPGTHDMGERLTTYSFAAISTLRPSADTNARRMQAVCQPCHGPLKITTLYDGANKLVSAVNDLVKQSDAVMADLKSKGLLTATPFDEPIDYTYFEIWHHWGRTAKFGAWMNGPDYTQWHGIYELEKALAELKAEAAAKIAGK
jgi:hydroxylamine dehydrogenase